MEIKNQNDNKMLFDPGREDRSNEHVQKKRKSSKVWLIVVAIIVAANIIGVNVLTYYSKKNAEKGNDLTKQSLIETNAAMRMIENKVVFTGKIKSADKDDIEVISGIEFDKLFYKNGDTVKEGDIIGTADLVSLVSSMENTRKMILDLDKELHTEAVDNSGSKIKAPCDGRVKAIYAASSDNVSDVVYEKGALMILSVDGKMAADINTDIIIGVDTAVKGKLKDGTEIKGRVASYSDGKMKVTFSDKNAALSDKIEVIYEGNVIGEGELYVNCPLKVVSFAGKVKSIKVKVGDAVKQDDTLITLTDDVNSDRYDTLMSQREDLIDDLKDMLKVYETGYIYADKDGILRGVDEDLYEDDADVPSKNGSLFRDNEEPGNNEEPTEPSEPDQTKPTDNTDPGEPPAGSDPAVPTMPPGYGDFPAGFDPAQYYALINGAGTMDPGTADMTGPSADEMVEKQYINEKKILYSIEENDSYDITIKVEDKNVVLMEEGMICKINPISMSDRDLEGRIKKISNKGTLSGKKAVYQVTVSFDRIPDLKEGMNAKVTIEIKSEPVLAIPIAAIKSQNNKAYVYTEKDQETGELTGLREITTGKSDSEYVEILSGLSDGDKIYYLYFDTIDYSKITNGVDTNLYM